MTFYQPVTNTAANGMGSHEEAKYRLWGDVDPELLSQPFDTPLPQDGEVHIEPSRPLSAAVAEAARANQTRHTPGIGHVAMELSFRRR